MVVWVFSWLMVFLVGSQHTVAEIDGKSLLFLILSGLATGASWLCYYKALQDGPASVVVPIDKLSILVTVAFSRLVFKERLSRRAAVGLVLLVAGTLLMIIR
jgi:transporter family protein